MSTFYSFPPSPSLYHIDSLYILSECTWDGPLDGFLAGCANDGCKNVNDIEQAKEQCSKDELCTGIIKVSKEREIYQLRSGGRVSDSPSGEKAWRKSCGMNL